MIIVSFYENIAPEKFGEAYQRLARAFESLGENPMGGLDERIKQANSILQTPSSKRTDTQWKLLEQIRQDMVAETKRYNALDEQQGRANVAQELGDLERSVLTLDVPESEREEVSLYFRLKREQGESYRDERFIAAVSAVERAYLLPLLKITQAHLTGKRTPRSSDWDYEVKLLETLPEFFRTLPPKYKDRIIDILVTSAERGNHASGIHILAHQISKQLGLVEVEYDDSKFTEPTRVPEEHKDFYLETAKRLAEVNSPFDTDILETFPHLVTRYGIEETGRIIGFTLRIKDEDFPGWNNVALFYIDTKSGIPHFGDQQRLERLAQQVEAKYQKPNHS